MKDLNLYPFPAWLTPQVPATNINAVSYEEMIRQFITKLNEVIQRCNDVQEFSEEVKRILDDMNAHIRQITTTILAGWLEDGTLKDILEDVSLEYFEALGTILYNTLRDSQISYDKDNERLYLSLIEFSEGFTPDE